MATGVKYRDTRLVPTRSSVAAGRSAGARRGGRWAGINDGFKLKTCFPHMDYASTLMKSQPIQQVYIGALLAGGENCYSRPSHRLKFNCELDVFCISGLQFLLLIHLTSSFGPCFQRRLGATKLSATVHFKRSLKCHGCKKALFLLKDTFHFESLNSCYIILETVLYTPCRSLRIP